MSALSDFPVGMRKELSVDVTEQMIDAFASLSGDVNALHMNADAARAAGFPRRVAHGCLTLSFVSTLIGCHLPGDGALWRGIKLVWERPVFPGDRITVAGEVIRSSASAKALVLQITVRNQNDTQVLTATADVSVASPTSIAVGDESRTLAAATPLAATPVAATPTAATPNGASSATSPRGRRIFIVTGGSRGIGAAVVHALAPDFDLIIGYRSDQKAAAQTAHLAEGLGARVEVANIDAEADERELLGPIAEAEKRIGRATGLVHAASPPIRYGELTVDEGALAWFDTYQRVYARAGLALARHMRAPIAESKWGRLLYIGTSYLLGAPPERLGAYVAAKSGLVGLVRSLAVELGPFGATVNLVSPSLTATDLARDVSPRMRMLEAQKNPARRLAQPEDTAALVSFLAGSGGAFISGAHLPVTGGAQAL